MSSAEVGDKDFVLSPEEAMPLQVPVRVHDACFTSGEPCSLVSPKMSCSVSYGSLG